MPIKILEIRMQGIFGEVSQQPIAALNLLVNFFVAAPLGGNAALVV